MIAVLNFCPCQFYHWRVSDFSMRAAIDHFERACFWRSMFSISTRMLYVGKQHKEGDMCTVRMEENRYTDFSALKEKM